MNRSYIIIMYFVRRRLPSNSPLHRTVTIAWLVSKCTRVMLVGARGIHSHIPGRSTLALNAQSHKIMQELTFPMLCLFYQPRTFLRHWRGMPRQMLLCTPHQMGRNCARGLVKWSASKNTRHRAKNWRNAKHEVHFKRCFYFFGLRRFPDAQSWPSPTHDKASLPWKHFAVRKF
jgi:hypothetical protein